MEQLLQVARHFLNLTLEIAPYFVAGTALAAVLDSRVNADKYLSRIGNGPSGIVLAALMGMFLPGCACATIPMAMALIKAGAGLGTATAFMMASPILSPQTAVLTWAMLGPKFALARIFMAFTGPVLAGLLFQHLERKGLPGFTLPKELPAAPAAACEEGAHSCCCAAKKKSFIKSFVTITADLCKYFLLGMLIAALFTWLMPEHAIRERIGNGPLAYLLALLFGIPVYVCEGQEIPITFALLGKGVAPGPAFTFMLGSVGTCIPTILMAFKLLGRKPTWAYLSAWAVFALLAGLSFSLLF
ncbi:MAG: hypothetical protein GX410_02800 [Elusimicrobia bacterium]|nr:hypothetical protein [Elusimicrobiota bacterium]